MTTSIVMAQPDGVRIAAPWAGKLIAFGARLARVPPRRGVQLVAVITVPTREYAALLVGAGWILTQPKRFPTPVGDVAPALRTRDRVRAVIGNHLVTGQFRRLHSSGGLECIQIGPSSWPLSYIQHLAVDNELTERRDGKREIPRMGSLVSRSSLAASWPECYSSGSVSLSLVGIGARFHSDLGLEIGWADTEEPLDRLSDILRLDDGSSSPCWAAEIIPGSSDVMDELDPRTQLTILDGNSGIRWLESLLSPIVVCIVDRSTESDELDDIILASRASGRVRLPSHIGWPGAAGIEVMTYEVSL